jgi:hypothetical protein
MSGYLAANRANGDQRVPIHVASSFSDVEGWLAGDRRPPARELDALGDAAITSTRTYGWDHSIGEIVTASSATASTSTG